ncbi:MAG: GNAT family N-acetyltransferase [Planctomycetaceae bacterium]|nr:GNAT family N-acetyltransferase [Planctomycetaceae bacterium]MCB9950038.1 GNAT family N-acetyltransferase [Planctomycetaceae bacterium]
MTHEPVFKLEEVLALERQIWQAIVERNGDALAELFDDEYIEIMLEGKRVLKPDAVGESPQIDEIESYVILAPQIRALGESSVLLNYHLTLDGKCRGIPIQPRDRWATSIWHNRAGEWTCMFFQQSHFEHGVVATVNLPTATLDTHNVEAGVVEITPMQTKHVPQVLDLWNQTEGLILTFSDNEHDRSGYFVDNAEMSQVALAEGKVVGAVLCGCDGRRGYLHHLAVAENYRRKGIGSALVDACLAQLARVGILQCNLFVIDDNAAGRKFCEKQGWSEWPTIRLLSRRFNKIGP